VRVRVRVKVEVGIRVRVEVRVEKGDAPGSTPEGGRVRGAWGERGRRGWGEEGWVWGERVNGAAGDQGWGVTRAMGVVEGEHGGKGDGKHGVGVAKVASSMSADTASPKKRAMVGAGSSSSGMLSSAGSSGAGSRVMSTPEPPVLGQGFMTCADVRRHGQ
jgi:hypothetical protein